LPLVGSVGPARGTGELTMIDREKAVERCKDCEYCHPYKDWQNCQYLACQVCANKWIVEVDQCPMLGGKQE